MTDRCVFASCSIELAPGWAGEIRVELDGAERTEYLAIVSESSDALLRLSTYNPEERGVDAAKWIGLVRHINRAKGRAVSGVQCGDFSGCLVEFEACEERLRGWALRAGKFPLDVSYRCRAQEAGRDDSAVDGMLSTLLFVNPGEEPAGGADEGVP